MKPTLESSGLPAALDAERLLLGSVLVDDAALNDLRGVLVDEDFSLEKNRRIWAAMYGLYDAGTRVDRVTLASELQRRGQLESVDGLSYLVSLDEGLPKLSNLSGYLSIVKDKALSRRIIAASQRAIDRCVLGEESAAEILESSTKALTDAVPQKASEFCTLEDAIQEFGVEALLSPRRNLGLPLPWYGLNQMLGGLMPEEVLVLAGSTSTGKTSMALQMATHAALRGQNVVVFSLEMSKQELFSRMIAQQSGVDPRATVLDATQRDSQHSAMDRLLGRRLAVLDSPTATVAGLRARLRKASMRDPLGLVVVDYLQLVSSSGKHENRTQEVDGNARAVKLMAKEFKCPFVLLSQLNREHEKEGRVPTLRDLREAGGIEQSADIVLLLHPDTKDVPPIPQPLNVRVMVAKQRAGQRNIEWRMRFVRQCQRFEEMSREDLAA